jgi:hypothetical protein
MARKLRDIRDALMKPHRNGTAECDLEPQAELRCKRILTDDEFTPKKKQMLRI